MNVLVIGGAGFVGVNLVRRCLGEPGMKISVLDSLDPLFHSTKDNLKDILDRIEFIQGDLRHEKLLAEVVRGRDVIFNCAAQTSHPLSLKYPYLDAEINCLGNLKILETVRLYNPGATVVFTSSSTIVGKAQHPVVDEDHPEGPLEIYSANKGVAEKYYKIYHTAHGLKTVCLRFANLYGPFGKEHPDFGFINYFIGQARNNQEICIFGDGAQKRNVMYIEDAAEILLLAAREPRLFGSALFATGDEHLSVREIAERIVSVYKLGKIIHVDWPDGRKRIEIDNVTISSKRLREISSWRPRYDFETGLRKTRDIMVGRQRGEIP
jgi:UDP-glucose 4-epimerase